MNTEIRRVVDYVYEASHLAELGVTLDEFEADPQAALDSVGQYDALDLIRAGLRPLLPAQVRLRAKLDRAWHKEGHQVVAHPRTYGDSRALLGLASEAASA